MTTNQPSNRFTPFTQIATTHPVLLIDTHAPLPELYACVSERLHATLDYLSLMACASLRDSATNDVNTVTNVARILVQDVADVFGVIERRGLES
ncbi:fructose-bisphosphate aldolase [Pseudomonas corrugata]|uniref:Fructose-bisphosphate aldolase n=1 Tax=Pseudomonas corrugata TaxID=47879 RepID=A0A7Y6DHV7_9PSED|nr:fructose-bisphosphate aldolase [Pseudomonas corrugata]NUT87628.1 fructose-bisphosphate aldolase [Pseudomonas corrugata]